MLDPKTFARWLGVLAEQFNRPPVSPDLSRVWYAAMVAAGLEDAEYERAMMHVAATSRFWPSPADVVAAARPRATDGARKLAALEALDGVRRLETVADPVYGGRAWSETRIRDELGDTALRTFLALGGAPRFRGATDATAWLLAKDWCEAYEALDALERAGEVGPLLPRPDQRPRLQPGERRHVGGAGLTRLGDVLPRAIGPVQVDK